MKAIHWHDYWIRYTMKHILLIDIYLFIDTWHILLTVIIRNVLVTNKTKSGSLMGMISNWPHISRMLAPLGYTAQCCLLNIKTGQVSFGFFKQLTILKTVLYACTNNNEWMSKCLMTPQHKNKLAIGCQTNC